MINHPSGQLSAVVLGNIQDGGLPHIGCRCFRCAASYDRTAPQEYAACLAIIDNRGSKSSVWIIDATPDMKYQLDALSSVLGPHPSRRNRSRQVEGIFLTHAHMGHIGGLPQLGPEAMAAEELPVYASTGLLRLLQEARLWQPLVQNLRLIALEKHEPVMLAPDLHLTPIPVPHRDEWGIGTFAFRIQGPSKSLLYLPDIDGWEQWPSARQHLSNVDMALVDATFFDERELGGRPPVAHPLVPHTLDLFADLSGRLLFTHLNHTNPLLDEGSVEHQTVLDAGAQIARFGQEISL